MNVRSVCTLPVCLALAATATQAQEFVYELEPHHAFVHFEALHSGTSTNRGRFDQVEGTVMLDRAAGKGAVDVVVHLASVNTGIASYNEHLLGDDFLGAKIHPLATFKGSDFRFDGDKLMSVGGELSLLGQTRPVTLTAQRFNCYNSRHFEQREVCGGDFEAVIMRSQFGMNHGLPGIPDEIRLQIQVEAVKR